MDCLFCKIINNEIPSTTIYEDEILKVFLDIKPTTNGDALIVPKKHIKDFRELDNELLIHINDIAKKLYLIYQDKLKCDGLTLSSNTDYGQDIKHYHLHFIPRYTIDEVKITSNKEILKNLDEIKEMLEKE